MRSINLKNNVAQWQTPITVMLRMVSLILCLFVVNLIFFTGLFSASEGSIDPFAAPSGTIRHDSSKESEYHSDIETFKVAKHLGGNNRYLFDMFVKLSEDVGFLRISQEYGLQNPSQWPSKRLRASLKIDQLQVESNKGKSMMETRDTSSRLDGKRISALGVRVEGQRIFDEVRAKLDDSKHLIRLIDEMKALLDSHSGANAITGMIQIQNNAGSEFSGQVVTYDKRDLIVRNSDGKYFRVAFDVLSKATTEEVFQGFLDRFSQLPAMAYNLALSDLNAGELIAYDDTFLYINDRFEGFVRESRTTSEFTFIPYEDRLEIVKEVTKESSSTVGEKTSFIVEQRLSSPDFSSLTDYGAGIYQVSIRGSTTALLCTNQTDFFSEGWSEMYLQWVDTVEVIMTFGNVERVRVYREATLDEMKEYLVDRERLDTLISYHGINIDRVYALKAFEKRFGLVIPESKREEAKAYRAMNLKPRIQFVSSKPVTTTERTEESSRQWLWLVAGSIILVIGIILLSMRRKG
jgi:hypothetical protein